jgi:hypothetical protein
VILDDLHRYLPDDVERALPDAPTARRRLEAEQPELLSRLAIIGRRIGADDRVLDAVVLATTRLALRHGSLGEDLHAYHNESHVFELAERRLLRLLQTLGQDALTTDDLNALFLFAACHDLRQRETEDPPGPVGGNEMASIAETRRILASCGFDAESDDQVIALMLMIAGSTFDARPVPESAAAADDASVLAGGALARGLALWLDSDWPHWRENPAAVRGERLARLAADLDTGNVGESFDQLCDTALRLCREREWRDGRSLDSPASATSCLAFLGLGQQHYFFELHRFCSREGERVFGPGKQANAARVRRTTAALLERFAARAPINGQEVVSAFAELARA